MAQLLTNYKGNCQGSSFLAHGWAHSIAAVSGPKDQLKYVLWELRRLRGVISLERTFWKYRVFSEKVSGSVQSEKSQNCVTYLCSEEPFIKFVLFCPLSCRSCAQTQTMHSLSFSKSNEIDIRVSASVWH